MLKVDTVRTNGLEMKYMSFGHGSRNFIVLPGLSVQHITPLAEQIAAQYRSFTEDYTVYLFDRRENLPAVYPTEDMARDTYAAMQALGIAKADFFGVSQGGMIAISLAVQFPDAVGKLVLGSASDELSETFRASCNVWLDFAEKGDSAGLSLAFAKRLYSDAVLEQKHDLFASQRYEKEDFARFIILTESILMFDLRDVSPHLSCPTLVLGSADDRVLGPDAAPNLAKRARAELFLYGAPYGHAVYDEAPDFLARVKAFLA